jgi:hypothetical protein
MSAARPRGGRLAGAALAGVALAAAAAFAAACQKDLDAPLEPAALDRPFFDCRVQPVLTKNCAALACHGAPGRYFKVFARNRLRLTGPESERNVFMRAEERAHNFNAARAFVDLEEPSRSLLLTKPLDQAAGGAFHVGATLFKAGDVFATTEDPDYQVLAQWIAGATEVPTCQEPGSNL